MADNALIVLHLRAGDRTFDFFLFSLAVYDIQLYEKAYNNNPSFPSAGSTGSEAYYHLRELFLEAPEQKEIAISFRHLLVLLSIVDHISKGLLDGDAEAWIAYLETKFPGLPPDWVTGYLQNAGQVFGAFRQQYGDLPGMETLLQRITALNQF